MPNLSFDSILQQERILLDEAAKKLVVFDKEAEGDQLGEVVYASLVSALDAANKNYDELLQAWQSIQQATQQGRVAVEALPQAMADRAGYFQGGDPEALNNIIMALRLCTMRPSDVWRAEIRRQADALLGNLHASLAQGQDPRTVASMAQIYTSAFLWFELAWVDADGNVGQAQEKPSLFSQLFSIHGALLVGAVATAGYFGGKYAVPYVSEKVGGIFGRAKNKSLSEAEVVEEDEEDEDDDGDEEEVEETTFEIGALPPLQLEAGV